MRRSVHKLGVTALIVSAFFFTPSSGSSQNTSPESGGERVPRAQEPKPPLPYESESVDYRNSRATDVHLAGTLTKPSTGGPFPAVLLISGAGPQDRDETVAGHKPFLVLADHLTRQHIAVLRVDDRGTGQSTGDFQTATTADLASDASAGVDYLASRKDIDPKRIGLIGLGEGAIEAAMIASSNPKLISFAVLLSGTAYPGEKVLIEQMSRAEAASGFPEEEVDADVRIARGLYKMVEQGRSESEMQQALNNVPEDYKQFAEPWKRRVSQLQSPWLRFFLTYDPSKALEKMQCPVLALFGAKDMTIDPELNAKEMKSVFSHGHNREAKVKVLPDLNYLLQKAKTGLTSEYATIPETMSPNALDDITTWVAAQAAK